MFYWNGADSLIVVIKREIISGQKPAQNLALKFYSMTEENAEANHLIDLDSSLAVVSGKGKWVFLGSWTSAAEPLFPSVKVISVLTLFN